MRRRGQRIFRIRARKASIRSAAAPAAGASRSAVRMSRMPHSENIMSKGLNQKKNDKKKPEKSMKEKKAEKNAKKAAKK
jgi:hypothetical protein